MAKEKAQQQQHTHREREEEEEKKKKRERCFLWCLWGEKTQTLCALYAPLKQCSFKPESSMTPGAVTTITKTISFLQSITVQSSCVCAVRDAEYM